MMRKLLVIVLLAAGIGLSAQPALAGGSGVAFVVNHGGDGATGQDWWEVGVYIDSQSAADQLVTSMPPEIQSTVHFGSGAGPNDPPFISFSPLTINQLDQTLHGILEYNGLPSPASGTGITLGNDPTGQRPVYTLINDPNAKRWTISDWQGHFTSNLKAHDARRMLDKLIGGDGAMSTLLITVIVGLGAIGVALIGTGIVAALRLCRLPKTEPT